MRLDTVPDSIAELDADWMTDNFRARGTLNSDARVTAVTVETIGEGVGFVGSLARLTLTYDGGAPGPATVIAKAHSADPGARTLATMYGVYEREVRFYTELADRVMLRSPRCHAAGFDKDSGRCLLLLEDLAATGKMGDQLVRPSDDEAALAMRELGRFHADAWDKPWLADYPWLAEGRAFLRTVLTSMYPATYPLFLQNMGDMLPQRLRDAIPTLNMRALALFDEMDKRPLTIGHGDFRLDNMCFGNPGADYRLMVLDWQSVGTFVNYVDVVYFLTTNLPVEQRREIQPRLLDAYLEELRAADITGCNPESLVRDMRESLVPMMAVGVINGAMLQPSNERANQLFEAIFERYIAAAEDYGSLDLI